MVERFTYAVLDDETPALDVIHTLMKDMPEFVSKGSWTEPKEALLDIVNHPPDLLFLDVEMPGVTGLQFLQKLSKKPITALVTAHPEYAIDAFALGVREYILKPMSKPRLNLAISNLKPLIRIARDNSKVSSVLSFKYGHHQRLHSPSNIMAICAAGNFSELLLDSGAKTLVSESLRALSERLSAFGFVRVHKSMTINVAHIKTISSSKVQLSDNSTFSVGRAYQQDLNRFY